MDPSTQREQQLLNVRLVSRQTSSITDREGNNYEQPCQLGLSAAIHWLPQMALCVEWFQLVVSGGIHWLPQMVLWVGWLLLGLSAGIHGTAGVRVDPAPSGAIGGKGTGFE